MHKVADAEAAREDIEIVLAKGGPTGRAQVRVVGVSARGMERNSSIEAISKTGCLYMGSTRMSARVLWAGHGIEKEVNEKGFLHGSRSHADMIYNSRLCGLSCCIFRRLCEPPVVAHALMVDIACQRTLLLLSI